jgi:hypothetical protein
MNVVVFDEEDESAFVGLDGQGRAEHVWEVHKGDERGSQGGHVPRSYSPLEPGR